MIKKGISLLMSAFLIFSLIVPVSATAQEKSILSVDEAAMYLQEEMVKRKPTIKMSVNLKDKNAKEVIDYIMLIALANEYSNSNEAGDYLKYNHKNIKYSYEIASNSNIVEYEFVPEYFTTRAEEDYVNQRIEEIVNELNLLNKSEYEKALAINDYIVSTVAYEENPHMRNDEEKLFTAYSALSNHIAVCQGFANLFYRLAKACGLEARIVINGSHGWNIVKVDGKYYFVDTSLNAISADKRKMFLSCGNHTECVEQYRLYPTEQLLTSYTISDTCYGGCKDSQKISVSVNNGTKLKKPNAPKISKLKKKKKNITVCFNKINGAVGYQIQYSTSKKFSKKTTKTTSVKSKNKKISKTIKNISTKKKYYFRVRSYKTVNGKKIYSSWSKVKSI